MKTYSLVFPAFFQFLQILNFPSEPIPSDPAYRVIQSSMDTAPAKIVFKSSDGGRTWQDITEGLPYNPDQGDFMIGGGFADNNGFYLRAGDGLFFNKRNSKVSDWSTQTLSDNRVSIFPCKIGLLAFNYDDGQILRMINGRKEWLPIYQSFQRKDVLTFFETDNGTAFIGTNTGLFKFVDAEKTWKQVFAQSKGVRKLVEEDGVLMGLTQKGIIRSTDNGDHWTMVTPKSDHGIDLTRINGGFAIITESLDRRFWVQTSHDGGNTWHPIDGGLPVHVYNIVQAGVNLYCSHRDGVSGSSDHGKTWKLLLPSVDQEVFHLAVSGNVIYAVRNVGGC